MTQGLSHGRGTIGVESHGKNSKNGKDEYWLVAVNSGCQWLVVVNKGE